MTACSSGKRCYSTYQLAEDALIDAHIYYEYGKGNGPLAVYHCEECGAYHFTSRGPMNEKLARQLADGTIKKLKEAGHWQRKFKNY